MKFRIENDWCEHSKIEKVTIVILLSLVVLAVISWAIDGFAYSQKFKEGYNSGLREWNQFGTDHSHHFQYPLSHSAPHSDFCKGYDAAPLVSETSDR